MPTNGGGPDKIKKETTVQVTSICGLPLVKTQAIIELIDAENKLEEPDPKVFILIFTTIVVVILACFWSPFGPVQNCPESRHIDYPSESPSLGCKDALNKVEEAHKSTKQQVEKLNKDIASLNDEKANLSRKLVETEKKLREEIEKLILATQEKEKVVQENSLLKSEKETIEKDLSSAQYTLGNCKNKNMDHEVQNLELLQEIESLKKELKAC